MIYDVEKSQHIAASLRVPGSDKFCPLPNVIQITKLEYKKTYEGVYCSKFDFWRQVFLDVQGPPLSS